MKIVQKHKFLLLLAFISLLSCESDDSINVPEVKNVMDITVDGVSYRGINESVGGNENCDVLFISSWFSILNKLDGKISIDISKDGKLIGIVYNEFNFAPSAVQFQQTYWPPNGNPTATFEVSDFSYNPETGALQLSFAGTLFLESNNDTTRTIAGTIKIESFQTIECGASLTGLNYESDNFDLFSNTGFFRKFSDQTQWHRYVSNNGYRVEMLLSDDLWNYDLGEIPFDEEDALDRVNLKRLTGLVVANPSSTIPEELKTFETSGIIVIENKYMDRNIKMISGKIFMTAKDNGQLVHTLNGITFTARSFE
jgi:hypothetical protein